MFVAFRLNFGLFDRLEVGLGHVSGMSMRPISPLSGLQSLKGAASKRTRGWGDSEWSRWVLNILVIRILASDSDEDEMLPTAFLVVSKTFNLPRIHQFSGHIGIGTQRFALEDSACRSICRFEQGIPTCFCTRRHHPESGI